MKVVKSNAHGDKLKALLHNGKLPPADIPRVEAAIQNYDEWIKSMDAVSGTADEILSTLIELLNGYKFHIEFDLIFNSPDDFLYRQNGQLKLANSILEEFLPRLFDQRLVPGFDHLGTADVRPATCFSHLSFGSPLLPLSNGGVFIKMKDQDFAVTKGYEVTIAELPPSNQKYQKHVSVAYFATEIKTNLDKTMFQEATATAGELKAAVPGACYILLCEWLDMSPIDTKLTPINEVIVLRKQKRIGSNTRDGFSTVQGRANSLDWYKNFLSSNPLHKASFERFLFHLNETFPADTGTAEHIVLERGYF